MTRCLDLAQNGLGTTFPNPLVGSIIVHNGRIIGEGWHRKAGEPHAEVNAINAVKEKRLLPFSTIYVSLEPCSHYGKTPPCSDLIIDKKIKNVVIGSVDPYSEVAGKGIKKLLEAGCKVKVGVLEEKCQEINKRFFTFHIKKRPYIILKWAQSRDGYLAPAVDKVQPGSPALISGIYSRQLVHKWRSQEEAIMIGTNTAVHDNPRLSTRLWKGNNPIRIILDRNLRIPKNSKIFQDDIKTVIITQTLPASPSSANVLFEAIDFEKELPNQIGELLYAHGLQSLILEGGSQTLKTFIDKAYWDEARVFIGNQKLNNGVRSPEISGSIISESFIAKDRLIIYRNA